MQRVAIIDYGSGNLHSAAKAFERAAREGEADAQILVTADPKGRNAPTASCCRASAPSPTASAGSRRWRACARRWRRRCGEGRPFLGICVGMQLMATRGLEFEVTEGLTGSRARCARSSRQDPASKSRTWAGTRSTSSSTRAARRYRDGPDGLHAYFVHSYHLVPEIRSAIVAETDYGGAGHSDGRQRQHRRHAVPPREEPDAGPEADRQLPQVAALDRARSRKDKPRPREGEGP